MSVSEQFDHDFRPKTHMHFFTQGQSNQNLYIWSDRYYLCTDFKTCNDEDLYYLHCLSKKRIES